MPFYTPDKLVEQVLNELALVSGPSVQTYTEGMILTHIQNAFDTFFKKRYWAHLCTTSFFVLDGTTGVTTTSVESVVEDIDDVQWIRQSPYREKVDDIPYIKEGVFDTNEYWYTALPYNHPQYTAKKFLFNPPVEALSIAIRSRIKPPDFVLGAEAPAPVPLDRVLMQHFVTASALASDGFNPAAQDRHQALADDRYTTLLENEGSQSGYYHINRYRNGEFTVASS